MSSEKPNDPQLKAAGFGELASAVGLDDKDMTSKALNNPHFPCYYLIDRKGNLRIAGVTSIDLEKAIQLLIAEK